MTLREVKKKINYVPFVGTQWFLDLDGIPGLVPGLVPGFQNWKCPGTLTQTCCGPKSLKFILIDSIFLCPPALNALVTLSIYPSGNQEFFFRKIVDWEKVLPGQSG